jgi:carboxymethylenebutenolidase
MKLPSKHDAFEFSALHLPAEGARKGGLILLHEIWGVTPGIKRFCQGFAADGYEVIAPQLLDRLERDFVAERSPENAEIALGYTRTITPEQAAGDVAACAAALEPPVFAVGYCYGGTVAWLAACRTDELTAATVFYSNGIIDFIDEQPRCPVIFHYGLRDAHIGPEHHERIRAAHPDLPLHLYDAGHGFFSDDRPEASPEAAALSRARTLESWAQATDATRIASGGASA